ncbi:MAG: spermidine synthase, partial [Elusimicrobia bacterium]|nr:spermidine synthase [Elusimicrobiota bacterium]
MKKGIVCAFVVTGACGLAYQVLWLRMFGVIFGNSAYAVSVVLAAYMAGLALGSWAFGRVIDRGGEPLRWYAALEAGIALYAVASPALLDVLQDLFLVAGAEGMGLRVSAARFLAASALLLIPTAMMGGSLPALCRKFAGQRDADAAVGTLYAANTWGAVLGTLL